MHGFLVPSHSGFFLCPLISPLLFSYLCFKPVFKCLLTKPHPNKNFHKSSPKNSHPTIASFVPDTYAKGLSDAVKKLIKQALHPFHSRPYAILYIVFFSSLLLMLCSTLLLLFAYFGTTVSAMRPVIVTLNQLYAYFLSLILSVSPLSISPPAPSFSGKLKVLLYKQIVCFSSLMIIFQAYSGIQDGNCLVHCSVLT